VIRNDDQPTDHQRGDQSNDETFERVHGVPFSLEKSQDNGQSEGGNATTDGAERERSLPLWIRKNPAVHVHEPPPRFAAVCADELATDN
jgi:hypothetical protein